MGSHASSTEVAASVARDPPIAAAYYSHHKCATMYVQSILERVCRECGFTFRSFHNSQGFGGDLAAHLSSHPVDFLSYINAEWNQVAPLGLVPGFHVVRDPRDIWVSAYFSHLYTHETSAWPELEEHRQRLKSVEKEEGLFIEMGFIAGVFEAIAGWNYQTGHVLELRFEELTNRPYTSFLRIFEHLGMLRGGEFGLRRNLLYSVQGLWNQWVAVIGIGLLPYRKQPRVPAERLLGIVYDNRFSKKTGGRDRGDEDRGSHYRKGVSGDWRKHLTDKHLRALQERFPGLLEVSGYGA